MKRYGAMLSSLAILFPFVVAAHGEPVDINDLADSVAGLSSRVAMLEGQVSDFNIIADNFNQLGKGLLALSIIVAFMVCGLIILFMQRKRSATKEQVIKEVSVQDGN